MSNQQTPKRDNRKPSTKPGKPIQSDSTKHIQKPIIKRGS